MKALAIIALIFSALSIIIPGVGIFLAMLCSIIALISFRSQPTLSGITFGLNIISTIFLSPMLLVAEAMNSSGVTTASTRMSGNPGEIMSFYVGFHVVLLAAAVLWTILRGSVE